MTKVGTMSVPEFRRALALTLPVMMGYGPLGIVFGFLLVQAGADWWLPPVMSLLVFAGAAQFLAIGMLAAGASISAIAAAVAIVNLRHLFYGISLQDILPANRWQRLYCIYALTDENYSLIVGMDKRDGERFAFIVTALNHSYWVLSALFGALLGNLIQVKVDGIEFSLTALFTVLAVEQYRRLKSPLLTVSALVSYVLALQFAPQQPLFVAMCLALILTLALLTSKDWLRRLAFNSSGDQL